ncbi:NUDIX hydrolase [Metaclostridioides mangenotii]|uniref:NUDIX hydrolase n=1 Tax=Metaclostridioides mangenotii TaxID=1540 RepID=UPI0004821039|nr:NUDIX hydrolase [Clostridioides mangenotii]
MVLEEKTIKSDKIYTGKIVSLRVDTVEIPEKGYSKREIIEHGGAVGIVAITDDKKIVLVKQFRKPIEDALVEIPAGKLEIGENPKECAIRELQEETGYTAENIKLIHKFYSSAGFSNEKIFIYLATGLTPGETMLESDEFLDVMEVDVKEAFEMVIKNEIEDAKSTIGILMTKDLI